MQQNVNVYTNRKSVTERRIGNSNLTGIRRKEKKVLWNYPVKKGGIPGLKLYHCILHLKSKKQSIKLMRFINKKNKICLKKFICQKRPEIEPFRLFFCIISIYL